MSAITREQERALILEDKLQTAMAVARGEGVSDDAISAMEKQIRVDIKRLIANDDNLDGVNFRMVEVLTEDNDGDIIVENWSHVKNFGVLYEIAKIGPKEWGVNIGFLVTPLVPENQKAFFLSTDKLFNTAQKAFEWIKSEMPFKSAVPIVAVFDEDGKIMNVVELLGK